jgi:hypothetical protein
VFKFICALSSFFKILTTREEEKVLNGHTLNMIWSSVDRIKTNRREESQMLFFPADDTGQYWVECG